MKRIWVISEKFQDPIKFFQTDINQVLLHEIFHMASSNYDHETNKAKSGLDIPKSNIGFEQNRGITEGITEILTYKGINLHQEATCYLDEVLIVKQLSEIVEFRTMLQSYFENKGTTEIKKFLSNFGVKEEELEELFRMIEFNFYIPKKRKQQVLSRIQNKLIKIFELKVNKELLNSNLNKEEIFQMIERYESYLITPNKIILNGNDADNYIGLTENVDNFECLKKTTFEKIETEKQF